MPDMIDATETDRLKETDVCLGLCTCPDQEVAHALAKLLIEQNLAACVNMLPDVRSVYRWKGEVQVDVEVQLLVKTRQHCLHTIERLLETAHPYDVPEWLVLPVKGGSASYLDWIKSSLK